MRIGCIVSCLLGYLVHNITASATQAPTQTTPSWWDTDYPKAVITLGILAGALLIGIGIAKLAEWFYKRNSVRDDASDISEHTKELLRKQLALLSMRKNRKGFGHKPNKDDDEDSETAQKARTSKIFKSWLNKSKNSRANRDSDTFTATVIVNNNGTFDPGSSPPSRPKTRISFSDEHKKYNDAKQQWEEVQEIRPVELAGEGLVAARNAMANGKAGKRSESPVKRSASPKKPSSLKSVPEAKQRGVEKTDGSLTSEEFEFIDETLNALDGKKSPDPTKPSTTPKTAAASPKSRTPSPTKRTTSPLRKDNKVGAEKNGVTVIANTAVINEADKAISPTEPPGLRPKTPLNKTLAREEDKQDTVVYSRYNVASPRASIDNNKSSPQPVTAWKDTPPGSHPPVKTTPAVKEQTVKGGNSKSPSKSVAVKSRPQTAAAGAGNTGKPTNATKKTPGDSSKARPVTASTTKSGSTSTPTKNSKTNAATVSKGNPRPTTAVKNATASKS